MEKVSNTKNRIVKYIMENKAASKAELSKQLNISMPTVISNANELVERKILVEKGVYQSTGGRKAKALGINAEYRYSVGIDITANHIGIVLLNLTGDIVKQERMKKKFTADIVYFEDLKSMVEKFLFQIVDLESVLGIGISLPGIIYQNESVLVKSHALSLENYSLRIIEQIMPLPVYFENDANAAMMAEDYTKYQNVLYLSLNNTLGGAICMNGNLYRGQNQKAGEFGHMILVPNGEVCYCGKRGCADVYCAASVLTKKNEISLDEFVTRLEHKDTDTEKTWNKYLDNLAMLISNIRLAYDTDIILGGDIGGIIPNYKMELGKKIIQYNDFDKDIGYLIDCTYKKEASAVGVAKHFLQMFAEQI